MTAKEKAAQVAGTGTASNTTNERSKHISPDPVQGWFDQAKPSRNRQQKKAWMKGVRR